MVRTTSIDAFNAIKENGLLSARRFEVYEYLFVHGPCTGNELLEKMNLNNPLAERRNAPNIVTRLGELRERGCVREVRRRICSVTGMNVIEWDVTDQLPVVPARPARVECPNCEGNGWVNAPKEIKEC